MESAHRHPRQRLRRPHREDDGRARLEVHEDTDEFFLVLDGTFDIAIRDASGERAVHLSQGDVFVVPKGTEHKPSSAGGSILMFEPTGTMTTGDRHDELPDHVDSTTGHEL